jgi:lysophospholipase L1-like esterase
MAKPSTWCIAAAVLMALPSSVLAQAPEPPAWAQSFQLSSLNEVPKIISDDCKVTCKAFETKMALRATRRALRDKRSMKVLAIGSSSTVGIGASSAAASYAVRLESDLERFLKGADIEMITRGISGEVALGAAERLKLSIADLKPDLVIWQVGTNDAIARIDEERFAELLRATLRWLKTNRIDVMLIDPQYVDRLAADQHYVRIVNAIGAVAREERIPLVNRFDAMAELARARGNGSYLAEDKFHLNDLGYRCMAEYAARAIVAGFLNAELEQRQGTVPGN